MVLRRSPEDVLTAARAAVPRHSLQSIADRWAALGRADGLVCPDAWDLTAAVRAIRRREEPPSPDRTRSPSPAPVPPPPLPLLPPELLRHAFSALDVRDLSRAARASSTWRDLAMPMLGAFEVAYVVARLVDRVGGPPAPDSDVGDSDDGGWRDDDGHDDRDVNGECIGCGVGGAAGHQCLSCGAPVEPWDGSYHYDFGWVDGPRLA